MPDRGGDAHHPRRPFEAVSSLGALIAIASCKRDAGYPATYQSDITLIGIRQWWHRPG
jgi:hypothetical protein